MNRQKCVLVVDDDENDVCFLRRGFEKAGLFHKLVHVRNGGQALVYLKGEPPFSARDQHPFPDLLLLDLKMPGTDGFDLLRVLESHGEPGALPVVVLSSSGLESDVEEAKRLGARDFLIKPIDANEYREIVLELHQRWLGGTVPSARTKP